MSSSQPTNEPEERFLARIEQYGWPLGCVLVVVALLLFGSVVRGVNFERTWGWDESMHVQLPAARIVEHVQLGEWREACDVVLACDQYPFVAPVFLAVVEGVFGVSETTARYALAGLWCAGLFALCALVLRFVREPRGRGLALCLVALFGGFAPIAGLYAPTLFLEASFAATMAFTLLAWCRRSDRNSSWRLDVFTGALFTAAFFTKFNYALLLALGLGVDAVVQLALDARTGRLRSGMLGLARVAVIPIVAGLWWFVLPWPGDLAIGAEHREAFASFLGGNQSFVPVAWTMRVLDWTTLIVPVTVTLGFLVALLRSLCDWRRAEVRCLWFVALGFVVPISLHPFHLDRFLLPAAAPLWVLASVGFAAFSARSGSSSVRAFVLISVVALTSLAAGRWWERRALDVLGLGSSDAKIRAYQEEQLAERASRSTNAPLPTGGLFRKEADGFLDLAAQAAGPTARVGWIGLSSELSPAAIHLGLLARGGSVERFLRDAHEPMDVTFESLDPNWTKERLAEFAARFDVIFATDPPDLAKRGGRAFTAKYRKMLVEELGWREEELGSVEVEKAMQSPYPVRLFACRPPKQ